MKMARRLSALGLVLALSAPVAASAGSSPFDLAGPTLKIDVTHAGATLPISETANLSAGDQISIKAELPANQSAHYLLITAFLRGPTNPPPATWFHEGKTWDDKNSAALKVTVPQGAQQVLVFLAPQTEGDYKTLVNTVRSRPGAFVRAAQDLNQAALDRSRLDAFLAAIHEINQSNPDQLKAVSPTLAHSLGIKLNTDCLEQATELQAPCLTQGQDSLVIDENHASIIEQLTSGYSAALMQQLSGSTPNGARYVSPYVSSLIDLAQIFESMRTAKYQYIPTLDIARGTELSLKLNTPPSFVDPKSVLVVALPNVEPVAFPHLHAADPKQIYCVEEKALVLPVDGAPLIFSTGYAHDMALRLIKKNGKPIDIPIKADPEHGGFVVDTKGLNSDEFDDVVDGVVHGYWGFAPYSGPEFRLQNGRPEHWTLAADEQQPLIVGREGQVHLQAPGTACVDSITLKQASDAPLKATWKTIRPGELLVTLPLDKAPPGSATLLVKQYGAKQTGEVPVQIFAQPSHLDRFVFYAGDLSGVLKGRGLDEVSSLTLAGARFTPAPPTDGHADDELAMTTTDAKPAAELKPGAATTAEILLKDGRSIDLPTTVEPPRPSIALIAKNIASVPAPAHGVIQLAGQDELPRGAQLTFSIRAQAPTAFSNNDEVQVATAQGTVLTTLTLASGLTLEDSHIAVATFDTGKSLSASAFGPLQFRVLIDGVASDWLPLATLVRLPTLDDLACPAKSAQPCKLSGADLFLIDSISVDPAFGRSTQVPDGFPGNSLSIPHPTARRLYVKLHDDPSVVDPIVFKGKPAT